MTENEIIQKFTRARRQKDCLAIQVLRITWPHPHEPKSRWHTIATLPSDADEPSIASERKKAAHHPRYFAVCQECKKRNPIGWMLDDHICQSCAEKNHGVVF